MDTPDFVEYLQDLLNDGFKQSEVAYIAKISTKTLERYIVKHNLQKMQYSDISDDDLVDLIIEIKKNHPNDGEVMIDGHLRALDPPFKVQRWRLGAAIHFCDPEGVKARWSKTIKRRQYFVPCPHYLWHIDGNHKLIKYKFVIHGGVDGFTRLVVFMNISSNNRASTAYRGFLMGIDGFNVPIRVRTDFGGENEKIWDYMTSRRGENAALVGSSVHNQPIEQLWGLINDQVTLPFICLFEKLGKQGWLDTDNPTDIMCLHYVFLPLIQDNLTRFALALNKRKISTEKQHTPEQLETQFLHLKEKYEGRPSDENEHYTEFSYTNPATLERPLQHIQCDALIQFPKDLSDELDLLPKPSNISQGRKVFKEVKRIIFRYVQRH